MPVTREIDALETYLAYAALLELFSDLELREEDFVQQVNQRLRPEGFRLIGSFEDGIDTPAAIAGFRTMHTIAWGYSLYIEDLVTRATFRGRGHATRLMQWLSERVD